MSNPCRAIEARTAGAAVWLLIAACALFATARPAHALDPHLAVSQYVFDNWQIQQGLPQNSVEAIARTPDGYLWLGASETIGSYRDLFDLVEPRHKVYAKRPGIRPQLPMPAFPRRWEGTGTGGAAPAQREATGNEVHKEADRLVLARYSPPGVVVRAKVVPPPTPPLICAAGAALPAASFTAPAGRLTI